MCSFIEKENFPSGTSNVDVGLFFWKFFFFNRTSTNNLKMPGMPLDTWEVPKVQIMEKKNKLSSNPKEEIACEPN